MRMFRFELDNSNFNEPNTHAWVVLDKIMYYLEEEHELRLRIVDPENTFKITEESWEEFLDEFARKDVD